MSLAFQQSFEFTELVGRTEVGRAGDRRQRNSYFQAESGISGNFVKHSLGICPLIIEGFL